MSCGIDHRCGSDPTLLWLWRRPEATALIQPLTWEPPYASGMALEKTKKKKTKNKNKNKTGKYGMKQKHGNKKKLLFHGLF